MLLFHYLVVLFSVSATQNIHGQWCAWSIAQCYQDAAADDRCIRSRHRTCACPRSSGGGLQCADRNGDRHLSVKHSSCKATDTHCPTGLKVLLATCTWTEWRTDPKWRWKCEKNMTNLVRYRQCAPDSKRMSWNTTVDLEYKKRICLMSRWCAWTLWIPSSCSCLPGSAPSPRTKLRTCRCPRGDTLCRGSTFQIDNTCNRETCTPYLKNNYKESTTGNTPVSMNATTIIIIVLLCVSSLIIPKLICNARNRYIRAELQNRRWSTPATTMNSRTTPSGGVMSMVSLPPRYSEITGDKDRCDAPPTYEEALELVQTRQDT